MNTFTSPSLLAVGCLAAVLATGCSSMSRDTAIGAGIGGVAGAVVTGGSATGAAVGAVVGGVIGNEVEKKKR
jgi:osmotically inducible lipoprotein OsmB